MKKLLARMLLVCTALLLVSVPALAQDEQLTLSMSRDWGYGGFNGDIQGLFSMRVSAPSEVVRVEFYIDDLQIGQLDQAPFNLQFNTDDYGLGMHELYALGYTAAGQEMRSNVITANFVPAQAAMDFLLPFLGVILAVVVLAALVPLITGRKTARLPLGAERKYGIGGGAICPKCHRPFPLSLFSMNMGFRKLTSCPFCRKMSLVKVETIAALRQAEQAELAQAQGGGAPAVSEEERLRKELDDSKFQ